MAEYDIDINSQFLTFRLGEEMFALDVSQVREILDVTKITKVPRSPDFMQGVINVRGSVVPVVDLHLKFGMPRAERTLDTRIVVMEIDLEGELTVIGALADAVHKWRSDFIKGIGKGEEDRFIIILDVDRVLSVEELAMVQESEDFSKAETVAA